MNVGDKVLIKPEWCGPNEDPKKLHVVVGVNGDRVDISWAEKSPSWYLPFMPIETVDQNMIVAAGE